MSNWCKLTISKTEMHNAIACYEETLSHLDKTWSGRAWITSKPKDTFIIWQCKRNRRLIGPQIRAELNTTAKILVSVSMVKWRLREANLLGRVGTMKSLLRPPNRIGEKCIGQMSLIFRCLDQVTGLWFATNHQRSLFLNRKAWGRFCSCMGMFFWFWSRSKERY